MTKSYYGNDRHMKPLPVSPMLLHSTGVPRASPGWVHQVKFDGVRYILDIQKVPSTSGRVTEHPAPASFPSFNRYIFHHRSSSPVFNQFVEFMHANAKHLSHVISLGTIGDSELSKATYYILQNMGLWSIPVFGYGDDWDTLDEHVGHGATYIALGGSAHRTPKERVQWANAAGDRHTDVRFLLLGTMNDTIIRATRQNVYSLDGTAWNATFKERRYEGRTKVEQSVANIRRKQALVEPTRLENGDWVYTNINGQISLKSFTLSLPRCSCLMAYPLFSRTDTHLRTVLWWTPNMAATLDVVISSLISKSPTLPRSV